MEELGPELRGSLSGIVAKTIKQNAEQRHVGHIWPFRLAT
jgi:hypothetical protein